MAVETKAIHHGAGTKGGDHGTRLVDNAQERVGTFDARDLVPKERGGKKRVMK